MKIITLGSGGWIPTSKQTSCFLIDSEESLIFLDSGTGISRLGKYMHLLNKYDEIHIILSHYHLDHIIGLCYICNWTKDKVINIYGPGKNLINQECKGTLSNIFTPPYFVSIESIGEKVNFYDYDLNGFTIGKLKIKISEQIHSGKSFGITIGETIHYATDTTLNENTFNLAQKVKLLLHDCWSILSENSLDHSSLEDIIKIQKKFEIEKIGLIHTNPNWNNDDLATIKELLLENNSIFLFEDEMVISL